MYHSPGHSLLGFSDKDLLKAVRSLERWAWLCGSKQDQATAVGVSPRLRFSSHVGLGFPGGALQAVYGELKRDRDSPIRLEASFFGLTGAMGVMPTHMSSMLVQSGDVDREPFRRLLEMLDHRAITLFIRSAERAMLLRGLERAKLGEEASLEDPFTEAFEGLVGQLGLSSRPKLKLSRWVSLYHAGHFASVRRPPSSLARIVREVTNFEATVLEQVGHWRQIHPESRSSLGAADDKADPMADPNFSRLGLSACAGNRVWVSQDHFRIRLGPVDYATFVKLQPGGELHTQLSELVRLYVGPSIDFDFQVLLSEKEVPTCRLASGKDGVRLQWSTWLSTKGFDSPVDDAKFRGAHIELTPA